MANTEEKKTMQENACALLEGEYYPAGFTAGEEGMALTRRLWGGESVEISKQEYESYRDSDQSPVAFGLRWREKKWDFACADAYGFLIVFVKNSNRYLAEKTWLVDPSESEVSISAQVAEPGLVASEVHSRREAIVRTWLPVWRQYAMSLVKEARVDATEDHSKMFPVVCQSESELRSWLTNPEVPIGTMIAYDQICFICADTERLSWDIVVEAEKVGRISGRLLCVDPKNVLTYVKNACSELSHHTR